MKLKHTFVIVSFCGILVYAFCACSSSNDTLTDDPTAVVTQEVNTTLKLGTHASYLWHMESAPDSLFACKIPLLSVHCLLLSLPENITSLSMPRTTGSTIPALIK